MLVLFTDFGLTGPYVGQMKAVLVRDAPAVAVVDLMADAPACDPRLSAYLLAALVGEFPEGAVFLCVVDPGVGSERAPVAMQVDGRWFVGPDNGLFELVARRAASEASWWAITWQPPRLSSTFHGRDLFAPVAAGLARGDPVPGERRPAAAFRRPDWPDELDRVIYVDHYGNAMTGLRADRMAAEAVVEAGGRRLVRARTFADVPEGAAFWYENAIGLVELAVNRGRADRLLGLRVGDPVQVARGRVE